MKKRIVASIALLLCLWPSARAQEITYALPSTTLSVQVEVEQVNFFAGPYANYARKFLNMDVKDRDAVSSAITAVEIVPRVEADGQALYTADAENAGLLSLSAQGLVALQNKADASAWRFLPPVNAAFPGSVASPSKEETRISYKSIQTEEAVVQVPVEHKVKSAKTMEDKAAEAAEMILSVRKDRLNIVSGNTDASYSGEAMGAALKELERIEQEYMALFQGYTVKRTYTASFDVVPEAGQNVQRYLAFRLTDNGPVPDGQKGVPYYIELEPEQLKYAPDDERSGKKTKVAPLHYRIPAVCRVRFTRDGQRLIEARIPVYQLGMDALYTLNK
jgi:hypothetical protein